MPQTMAVNLQPMSDRKVNIISIGSSKGIILKKEILDEVFGKEEIVLGSVLLKKPRTPFIILARKEEDLKKLEKQFHLREKTKTEFVQLTRSKKGSYFGCKGIIIPKNIAQEIPREDFLWISLFNNNFNKKTIITLTKDKADLQSFPSLT